jgi:kumamolisin
LIASAVKSISDQQESTRKLADDVLAAKDSVNTTKQQAEGLLARAQELVTSISEQQQRATTFVALIEKQVTTGPSPNNPSTAPKATAGFTVLEVGRLYNFPASLDGRGQTIGMIELGGGIQDSDLDPYFRSLKVARPVIAWVGVDGAKNQPNPIDGSTQFVTQSIEIVGALAPAARLVLYFAPNTNRGFVDAIQVAANDKTNHPSVLLIGWGAPESTWTAQAMDAMNAALELSAARGVTVIVSSTRGDDFPGSSPWVLACGGTRFAVSTGGVADSEEAWSAGGASTRFPLPAWQAGVDSKGSHRSGPDVAALASPDSGYQVYIGGKREVTGGVTAAASVWAGLIAILNQGLGRDIGFLNPILYRSLGPSGAVRAVTKAGSEVKGCSAGPGWNTCAGWGTPDGNKLLNSLRLVSSAAK